MLDLQKRKEFFLEWFRKLTSDKTNLILIGILLFALAVRIYFYFKTSGQALWWDEADYLSIGKDFGLGISDIAPPYRARAIAMLIFGPLYFLGLGETGIRILEVIISLAGVYVTFLIGKEFFDEKIGLIAAFIMAVFYEALFWTNRISLDHYALVIFALIGYFFWKGYVKNGPTWMVALSFGLVGFGIFGYESIGVAIPFLLLFLLVTEHLDFLKNKKFWIAVAVAIIVAIPFLIYNYNEYGSLYPRLDKEIERSNVSLGFEETQIDFTELFSFFINFPRLLQGIFFVLFIIGLLYFMDLFLGFDLLLKKKEPYLKKHLFLLFWLLAFFVFFSLLVATGPFYYEPRYLFPILPIVFSLVGFGLMKIYRWVEPHNKQIAIVGVLLILGVGGYFHLVQANDLIFLKKDSFAMERSAGEWLKENTVLGDNISVCTNTVPFNYYAERNILTFGQNVTRGDEFVELYNPKYVVVDAYYWDCVLDYAEQSKYQLSPVQVYYVDEARTQVVIIIYEVVGEKN